MVKLVSYCRVSTQRQGDSGLGLDAQQAAIALYVQQVGGTIVGSFIEVESGKGHLNRPELKKAQALATATGAKLCIAKLDRLSRNLQFLAGILAGDCDIVCCDNPSANRTILGIFAVLAEDEARRISERTKAALAVAKQRGVKLGGSRANAGCYRPEIQKQGAAAASLKAKAFATNLAPTARRLADEGRSLRQIATALNDAGTLTRRNKLWNAPQVRRLLVHASASA